MTQPDDSLLMAYADGEVTPEQAAEVEALLARDPEARALVASFRDSASMVRAAFQSALDEPVPPALLAAARGETGKAAATAKVVAFRPRAPRPTSWATRAMPLAASVAVAVVAGGWWLQSARDVADPLSVALSSAPASQAVTLAAGSSVVPVSTFKIADGRWCREFERTSADGRAAGVACRGDDGAWQVEVLLPAGAPVETVAEEGYALAGAEESPLDSWLDSAGAAASVPPADEAALLAGWR